MDIPVESPVMVSLFSGGLDSLAGLAQHALNSPGGSRILVSGRTHNRLACQQDAQVSSGPHGDGDHPWPAET